MALELYPRTLERVVRDRLREEPVIVLGGPRAAGKTTLVQGIGTELGVDVLDLSDRRLLQVAQLDPDAFLADRPEPVLIDEYQLAPELLPVVKRSVDANPRGGAFLLTGSTTGALLPRGTESLAGRSHTMTLWGLSQGELTGHEERFTDLLFLSPETLRSIRDTDTTRADYARRVTAGGFPAALRRSTEAARLRWFHDYANAILERDLIDLVHVRRPAVFRRTIAICAARTAQVTNLSELANALAAGRDAVRTYVELLERVNLVQRVEAFSRNPNARVTKHPKLHLTDSGLAAALVGETVDSLVLSPAIGALLETFVVGEIRRQLGWSEVDATISHFRDRDGHEVDVVLESRSGDVVGIEVKAASTVGPADTRGLERLADHVGPGHFRHGIVLYTGPSGFRLDDDRFTAAPVSAIWTA